MSNTPLNSKSSRPSGNNQRSNNPLSQSTTSPKNKDDDIILRWSALEYERDTKRRALEANFEERAIVQTELLECQRRQERLLEEKRKLEYELQHVDDQIMSLEDDYHQSTLTLTLPSATENEQKITLSQQYQQPMKNSKSIIHKNDSKSKNKLSLKDHFTRDTLIGEAQLVNTIQSESKSNDNQQAKQTKQSLQHYPWSQQVLHLLTHTFRIPEFRQHQKEVIDATLSQQDVFCIMRTGGGKSLTYQLPAILEGKSTSRKVTVVVSPLLSLIQDQEEQMNHYCPNSAVSFTSANRKLSSKQDVPQQQKQWSRVKNPDGGVCIILVTPERIHKSKVFMHQLQSLNHQGRLGRFVIDEAHCATQWGHDFRPDYAQLGKLKQNFPHIPLLALTATASDPVRKDVCQILRLKPTHIFLRSSANRPNLKYSVRCKPDTKEKLIEQMVQFIQEFHPKHAGIVYTFSRKEADDVAKQLKNNKIAAAAYHSSISAAAKYKIHDSWMRNKIQVVVATIAFGLGINKPDVRFVLHHSISKTLEAYYQESGRAGRDDLSADCVLWYSPRDVPKILAMISGTSAERSSFWPMIRYGQAHGNDAVCRAILMTKLGEPNSPDPSVVHKQNEGLTSTCRDVSEHVRTLLKMMQAKSKDKLTLSMIVKEWRSKSSTLAWYVKFQRVVILLS
jgi:ATP-dependent DNA helicase Q1